MALRAKTIQSIAGLGSTPAPTPPPVTQPVIDTTGMATLDESVIQSSDYSDMSSKPFALGGKNMATDAMRSLHTRLAHSPSKVVQGLNNMMFINPQGAKEGGSTARTVADVARTTKREFMMQGGGAAVRNTALAEFAGGQMKAMLSTKVNDNFNRETLLAIKDPSRLQGKSKAFQDSVKSIQAQFAYMANVAKDAGVTGFKEIMPDTAYYPAITKQAHLVHQARQKGVQNVLDTMSLAYQQGGYQLPKDVADKVAQVEYIRHTSNWAFVGESQGAKQKIPDSEFIAKQLKKAGVPDDEIDAFISMSDAGIEKEVMSARAKRSLKADITAEVNGLSFMDLIDTNIERVLEGYGREMSGNVGLSKVLNVGSYGQMERILQGEKARAINDDPTLDLDELEKDFEVTRKGLDVIFGKSIDDGIDSRVVKGLGRLRQIASVYQLPYNGLSSMVEASRIIGQHGLKTAFKAMPSIRPQTFKKFTPEDFNHLSRAMKNSGQDWAFEPYYADMDNFEELSVGADNKMAEQFDRVLAATGRASQILSGQRYFTSKLEEWSANSVMINAIDGKITDQQKADAKWKFIDEDGYERDVLEEAKPYIKGDTYDWGRMPPDIEDRIREGTLRLVYRDVQRAGAGENPLMFHTALGQAMTQYKTFTYGSISKQLIHDVRAGDKMAAVQTLVGGLALSQMAQTMKAYVTYTGDSDLQSKYTLNEFLDLEVYSPQGQFFNVFLGASQVSGLGFGADFLGALGALPDELMAGPENNYIGSKGLGTFVPPATGVLKNMAGALSEHDYESVKKVVPFANYLGISQTLSALEE